MKKAGFGGGCHWCTEAVFQRIKGVIKVEQGWVASTGDYAAFSEAVIVHFDEAEINLPSLIEIHLHTHSCTSAHSMRSKYRSAIYYFTPADRIIAEQTLTQLQPQFASPIITMILPFASFKENSPVFLNYYRTNPDKPFCKRFIDPKLNSIQRKFKQYATDLL